MTSKGIHPNTTSLQPLNSSDIEATNLHEQNEELNQQKGPGKSRAVLIEDHNFPETKRSYLITVRYSCVCVCVCCVRVIIGPWSHTEIKSVPTTSYNIRSPPHLKLKC